MTSIQTTPGILSLPTLLRTLRTKLHPETFVFVVCPPGATIPTSLDTNMTFKEDEGITVITTLQQATEYSLHYDFVCRKITLDVHSNLDAVGFLATVTTRLARELNIGVNPVSGFYHDHLFVKVGAEEGVLRVLGEMAAEAGREISCEEVESGDNEK